MIPKGPKADWVLFWRAQGARPGFTYIWNPATYAIYELQVNSPDPYIVTLGGGNTFCSGHAALPDGRLLVAGSQESACGPGQNRLYASLEAWIFDPSVLTGGPPAGGWQAWSFLGQMNLRRWYPTVVLAENGDVLIIGGMHEDCSDCPNGSPNYRFHPEFEVIPWSALQNWTAGSPPLIWDFARDQQFGCELHLPNSQSTGSGIGTLCYPASPNTPTPCPAGPYYDSCGLVVDNKAPYFGPFPRVLLLGGPATIPGTTGAPTADLIVVDTEWGYVESCGYSGLISRRNQQHFAAIDMNLTCPNAAIPPANLICMREEPNVVRIPGQPNRFAVIGGVLLAIGLENAYGRAEIHDVQIDPANGPAANYAQTYSSLQTGRIYGNSVIVADGTILILGGSTLDYQQNQIFLVDAVYGVERLNPTTGAVSQMAPAPREALYHSVALLLPDGRVVLMGGDWFEYYTLNSTNTYNFNGDVAIYSPPYLFNGPRPSIGNSPASFLYGLNHQVSVRIPPGQTSVSLSLIRPCSVTHAFDFEQRYVPLQSSVLSQVTDPITGWTNVTLLVTSPANGYAAPPGFYMLFALAGNGVPSVAAFVQVQ